MGKNTYWKWKAEGRCTQCGRSDVRTAAGSPKCAECAEKDAAYHRRNRARQSARERATYQYRVENRRCTRCDKPLGPLENYRSCFRCRLKHAEWKQAHLAKEGGKQREKGESNGISK